MTYSVWVRLGSGSAVVDEWTFTEDPDHGGVSDGVTVLTGMEFGWSMPGPLWPRQPETMTASLQINLPAFSDMGTVTADSADSNWLAIEVFLDDVYPDDPLCRFYGDVTDLKATPREAQPGVVLSVVAVDYLVRLREEFHPQYVITDDATATSDNELLTFLWNDGELTGLGQNGSLTDVALYSPGQNLDDAYLNLDGPLPVTTPELIDILLDGAVGTDARMIIQPMVVSAAYPDYHGMRTDQVAVGTAYGADYQLDLVLADPGALPVIWEVDAGVIYLDDLAWTNVKGRVVGTVTTTGWGGVAQNRTDSPVTGATGDTVADVPVYIQDEVNAQGTGDFYAALAGFNPWQIDTLIVPVSRVMAAYEDPADGVSALNLPSDFFLFPDLTDVEGSGRRTYCYSAGMHITGVDTSVTPDGLDVVEGIIVGVDCVIDDQGLSWRIALRRRDIATVEPPTSVRATLTIGSGEVSSDLTGFVTRVDLDHIASIDWWAMCEADGVNIRVYASDGVTLVPFDVTWCDGSSAGELFFRANLLTGSSNVFYIDVEDGATALATTDPNGRDAVWQDYDFVQTVVADYLNGGTAVDRTGNGASISILGTGVTLTSSGYSWDATATGVVAVTGVPFSTTWTIGCRSRQNVNDGTQRVIIDYGTTSSSGTPRASLKARQSGTDRYAIQTSVNGDLLSATGVKPSTFLNSFMRWVVTHTGATARAFYYAGASTASGAITQARPQSPGDTITYGGSGAQSTSGTWRGEIAGPIYLRAGNLSAAWIAGEASSWDAPSGFYTIT